MNFQQAFWHLVRACASGIFVEMDWWRLRISNHDYGLVSGGYTVGACGGGD